MFCTKCGAQLQENQKFCHVCGQVISDTNFYENASMYSQSQEVYTENENYNHPIEENYGGAPQIPVPKPIYQPPVAKKPLTKRKIAIIIIVSVLAVALLAGAITLVATTERRRMNRALKTQSWVEVTSAYSIAASRGKEEQACKAIIAYVNKATDKINSDFTVDIDTIKSESDVDTAMTNFLKKNWGDLFTYNDYSITYLYCTILNEDAQTVFEALEKMISSKENFYKAEFCMKHAEERGDYRDAMQLYMQVSPDDEVYSKAVENVKTASKAYIDALMKIVDEYMAKEDFSAAIKLLERELHTDSGNELSAEIKEAINSAKQASADKYVQRAAEAFKQGNIDEAVGCMEAVLSLFPENGAYKAKLEEYKMYKPFPLYVKKNMIKYEADEKFYCFPKWDVTQTANNNEEMPHSIAWFNNGTDITARGMLTYHINGNYDTLRGTLYLEDHSRDTEENAYIEIYGDGKLLYTSSKMASGIEPIEITCSVKNVQTLMVVLHAGKSENSWSTGYFGLSNLQIQKDVPQE